MRPEELQKVIRSVPFKPVKLSLTDGTSYVIRHPEMALIGRSIIAIGTVGRDGIADEMEYVSLLHVVKAHHVNGEAARADGSAGA